MSETNSPSEAQSGDASPAGEGDSAADTIGWDARVKTWLKAGWKFALIAGVAGLVVYRLHFAPIPVSGSVVAMGPIVSEVMGTGTLEARVQATISPKISGLISQVLTDQGERVTNGQLLVVLYDGDLREQAEVARALCQPPRLDPGR